MTTSPPPAAPTAPDDIGRLGHDLRTPLNAILGFSMLMRRDDNLTPAQREQLMTIERSGRRLLERIDRLLEQGGVPPVDFEPAEPPAPAPRVRAPHGPAPGAVVLVVDDAPANVELLSQILHGEGMTVLGAGNGLDAIAIATERQPDLVLLDVQMDGLDGFQTCGLLKADPRTRDIPVIFMTVATDTATKLAAFEAGAADYVTKPFHLDEALARVNTQLKLVQGRKELARLNADLEERVRQRTAELEAANRELQSLCHAMAHDLRGPLGALDGFSTLLAEQLGDVADARGRHYLSRIRSGVKQMDVLTEALLSLAHLALHEREGDTVDLAALAAQALEDRKEREPGRRVQLDLQGGLEVRGDRALLKMLVTHLVDNAWKFTAREPLARIEVGRRATDEAGSPVFFVRDNGTGFDMAHADKLFQPFQRLHGGADFAGVGVGLAMVERIVRRHGGRVWAQAAPGQGTTFYFTLSPASAGSA